MNRLTTGEAFGAAALFGEAESYVTEIAALRPCVVLFLSQELVTGWMRAHFPVAENYIRFLTGQHPLPQRQNRRVYRRAGGRTADRVSVGPPRGGRSGDAAGQPAGAGPVPEHRAFQSVPLAGRADAERRYPPAGAAGFMWTIPGSLESLESDRLIGEEGERMQLKKITVGLLSVLLAGALLAGCSTGRPLPRTQPSSPHLPRRRRKPR